MSEEMTGLKCKSVLHQLYSPDMAITDFNLFGVLKQTLHGIDVSNDEQLKSEFLTIFQGIPRYSKVFQGIPSDELKKSFNHWIERCQWVGANAGNYYPSLP
jgi:hypothetical protein